MVTSLALAALNRVLRSNDWAAQRLRAHAGKTARIECLPLVLTVEVQPSGELAAAHAATPDAAIGITPGVLLRLLAGDEAVWSEIAVRGDSDFATVLHQVWQQLDWGVEEDLSHLFGDIAAHRIATTARQARGAVFDALDSGVRNIVEYWTEERPLVALRRDLESYNREVDALRDDVARLEKRVEALQAGAAARFDAEYGHKNTVPPTSAGA